MIAVNSYRTFNAKGDAVTLDTIVEAMKDAEVLFIGESHDDKEAHHLQFEILRRLNERYGKTRAVALSMEMFERDVQIVVDEYLGGLITETHFLQSSRPWNNYAEDYRPMIEYARENNLAVIAANAPRRYVNRVGRLGRDSLNALSPQAKAWLAPLPFAQASDAYAAKFNSLMNGNNETTNNKDALHAANNITKQSPMLEAQSLWDATMASAIAEHLKKNSLIVQLNGSFHSAARLGAPEHLLRYRPNTRLLVLTIKDDESYPNFDAKTHTQIGDFVIITPAVTRQ